MRLGLSYRRTCLFGRKILGTLGDTEHLSSDGDSTGRYQADIDILIFQVTKFPDQFFQFDKIQLALFFYVVKKKTRS